jgi:predicted Rossmann-fold nucleotide-binding protein
VHDKPCAVVNTCGYFDPLLALLDHAVSEQFLRTEHRSAILVGATPGEALELMSDYRAPRIGKRLRAV